VDAQFGFSTRPRKAALAAGQPVISVDTRRKSSSGTFKNAGLEWRPKGEPELVRTHDFKDKELGKAIPYGIYDLADDTGWVNVGIDNDTAQFVPSPSIRSWWEHLGSGRYPDATTLPRSPAHCGGSNGTADRPLEDRTAKARRPRPVSPSMSATFPPGTSKWNKNSEHRLLQLSSQDMARQTPHQPRSHHQPDRQHNHAHRTRRLWPASTSTLPKGIKSPHKQLAAVNLTGDPFHPTGTTPSTSSLIKSVNLSAATRLHGFAV